MRQFRFSDARSHKFWNIDVQGPSFTVTFGRVGSTGQAQTKTFASPAAAQKEADKLVLEKLAKGYVEVTANQPKSTRQVLEDALVKAPDDLPTHAAYADCLLEADDVRGELIQVQLALEDESRPREERGRLRKREQELLAAHQRGWLGDLAETFLDQEVQTWQREHGHMNDFRIARGWLDSVKMVSLGVAGSRRLAQAPLARLLRRLEVWDTAYEEEGEFEPGPDVPEDFDEVSRALAPLFGAPWLDSVRAFDLGEPADPDPASDAYYNSRAPSQHVPELIARMPCLEELRLYSQGVNLDKLFGLKNLSHLRVLHLFHMYSFPLEKLAGNPAFANLEELLCHPHGQHEDERSIRLPHLRALLRSPHLKKLTRLRLRLAEFGDEGVAEIVRSGALKRLTVLDLRLGHITDKGARALAACPDVKNLKRLNLISNALTGAGVAALSAAGVPQLEVERQHGPGDGDWLFEGDGE
jgi:uncharacterized protein (TIGR02996 family)